MRTSLLLACVLVAAGVVQASAGAGAPTAAELAAATYKGVSDEPVTLSNGKWEGEPFTPGGAARPRVVLVRDFRLEGDLDEDGVPEAVVVLAESSGGSGSNAYLAVVARRDGALVNVGTALIGDRVQIRSGRVSAGRIEIDVVQAGPDDAACCPSQTATRVWTLEEGAVSELESVASGTLSLSDLSGEWVLSALSREEPAPAEPEITLTFSEQGVGGSSGCNRYFGSAESGEAPGDVSFGPLGGTRRACPEPAMQLEQRYLAALGSVLKFGFLAGKLALTYRDGDSVKVLLFAPRESGG